MNSVFDKVILSPPKTGPLGMQFINLTSSSEPLYTKILGVVAYEPSVYNGTGEETRKGIVLELSGKDADELSALDVSIRSLAGIPVTKWNACVCNSRMKAKINMSGERPCEFEGPNSERGPPRHLRGREVAAVIAIKGIYQQKNASGLMIDVVALRYEDVATKKCPSFLDMLK